jgi:hypothetical protein
LGRDLELVLLLGSFCEPRRIDKTDGVSARVKVLM